MSTRNIAVPETALWSHRPIAMDYIESPQRDDTMTTPN
jgi:hypothetical protein